jgi:hypothetical protein
MQDPASFYAQELDKFKTLEKQLKGRSNRLSITRIAVFLMTVALVYFFGNSPMVLILIILTGIALFLGLLSIHSEIRTKKSLVQRLLLMNLEELDIAKGNYLTRQNGEEYAIPHHEFSQDIDLFGRGSFFQYMNRTGLKEGAGFLAQSIQSDDISAIRKKQKAVSELSEDPAWLQRYTALAQELDNETPTAPLVHWIAQYKAFLKPVHRFLAHVFGIISLLLLALTVLQVISISVIGYWILLGLAFTSLFLKKVNKLSSRASSAKVFFKQYALLLKEIEERRFETELLLKLQKQIEMDGEKASSIFRKFSKRLDALDHRNNLLVGVLGNGLFLWDLQQSFRIEQWIKSYGKKAEDWFQVAAAFDAYNSLGLFAFNHQEFCYPEIADRGSKELIHAKHLGHPLIATDKRVCSDLEINSTNFFIITGANMAGKSTFLRAVALHIVMANLGLPVCAKSSVYQPIKFDIKHAHFRLTYR